MGDIPQTEGMAWEQQDASGGAGQAELLALGLSEVCVRRV